MKKDIHPKYYPKAKVTCACGNTFEMGSTVSEFHVEICSACHPLYSGKHKFVDTARRVDKFQEKIKKAEELQAKMKQKKNKNIKKTSKK